MIKGWMLVLLVGLMAVTGCSKKKEAAVIEDVVEEAELTAEVVSGETKGLNDGVAPVAEEVASEDINVAEQQTAGEVGPAESGAVPMPPARVVETPEVDGVVVPVEIDDAEGAVNETLPEASGIVEKNTEGAGSEASGGVVGLEKAETLRVDRRVETVEEPVDNVAEKITAPIRAPSVTSPVVAEEVMEEEEETSENQRSPIDE